MASADEILAEQVMDTIDHTRNSRQGAWQSALTHNEDRPLLTEDASVVCEQLLKAVRQRWRGHRKRLKNCRNHPSEKAVHFLRVESRRLLSALELLGSVVTHSHVQKARRKLKKLLNDLS